MNRFFFGVEEGVISRMITHFASLFFIIINSKIEGVAAVMKLEQGRQLASLIFDLKFNLDIPLTNKTLHV